MLVFQFRNDGLYTKDFNYNYRVHVIMDIVSLHTAAGNIHTVEIGGIIMQNNEHIFEYLPGEGGDTLWPGMYCIINTMHGCYYIIIRLLELARL